jgi:hypothetical protein
MSINSTEDIPTITLSQGKNKPENTYPNNPDLKVTVTYDLW